MIYVGTSGFSYADWKGPFYPERLANKDMLAFYSRHFNVCEINATYYRMLTPQNCLAMVNKSGRRVKFVVKTHQSMTHQRNAKDSDYVMFKQSLVPMAEGGVLGGILAQFPYSFTNTLENRGYLADLKERLGFDEPLVVEFRHQSWARPEVADFLRSQEISIVNVDEPNLKGLVPPQSEVSGRVGYVRFHGRNCDTWFKKDAQPWERYNYLYSVAELEGWIGRIEHIAGRVDDTFIFFNNHWQSQAVANAKEMAKLLNIPGTDEQQEDLPGKQGRLI